jgi:hypothetical protein
MNALGAMKTEGRPILRRDHVTPHLSAGALRASPLFSPTRPREHLAGTQPAIEHETHDCKIALAAQLRH